MSRVFRDEQGIVLLGVVALSLVLVLLSTALMQMAGQEVLSAAGAKDAAATHQLADAAADAMTAWFHAPDTAPPTVGAVLVKRQRTAAGSPTFFDATGRSQFVGSTDHPDVVLNAALEADQRVLNDPATGIFRAFEGLGTVQSVKFYAPSTPGLLGTVEATVAPTRYPMARATLSMQLAAIDLPALRAGIQIGGNLGQPMLGQESPAMVHWGTLSVGGQWVVSQLEDIPARSALAPITSQGYREMGVREDRWSQAWVGSTVYVTQPPVGASHTPLPPLHVHSVQNPLPGVPRDQWDYAQMKAVAKQFGVYAALGPDGLVYPDGFIVAGQGQSADDWLRTTALSHGPRMVVIDTLDQAAPNGRNLGVLTLHSPYIEGTLVVFGHVVMSPSAAGHVVSVWSPPTSGGEDLGSRMPVNLSGIHLNGALYAAGDITVTGQVRVFGAVVADGTLVAASPGSTVEVWYNHELSQGLVRGVPIVRRAPGTWLVRE